MSGSSFIKRFELLPVWWTPSLGVSWSRRWVMQRRRFTREFNVLRNWVKEFGSDSVQAFPGHGQMKPEQLEVERLRREVNKLNAERDILKTAAAFFAKEATWSSSSSRSTGRSGRWHGYAMRWAYQASLPATGPTAHGVSGATGWQQALNVVCTGSDGWCARRPCGRERRRLPQDNGDRQFEVVPSNLLDRLFAAERPNQNWIADFTYIWRTEGWLYVAAVIDLFSRRVVGQQILSHQKRGQGRCARLHRAVLQCDPTSFDDRIPQPCWIRTQLKNASISRPVIPQWIVGRITAGWWLLAFKLVTKE
jgi:hypothetical protein